MAKTAAEHFQFCVDRANEYFDNGNAIQGMQSFMSDMEKHKGTQGRIPPVLGFLGLMEAQRSVEAARKWVKGFPSP